jgi:hypothetical protein
MSKELLFSVTKKDFDWTYFRASGAGGQHRNTTDSAVRCQHKPSGSEGVSSDERSQYQNKTKAFNRCVNSPKFQIWLKMKCSEMMMEESVDHKVDRLMDDRNIKTEVKNEKGQWVQMSLLEIQEREYGVHRTHCCLIHGCKYGDEDCPVANGIIEQEYPCEECED